MNRSQMDEQVARVFEITVRLSTGGEFCLKVQANDSVASLKKIIASKLKMPENRICLLHKQSQLQSGSVADNSVSDGSEIILLPTIESGSISLPLKQSDTELDVICSLQKLTSKQVCDFMGGRAPLNLKMKVDNRIMLLQLEISVLNKDHCKSETLSVIPEALEAVPELEIVPDAAAMTCVCRNLVEIFRKLSSQIPVLPDQMEDHKTAIGESSDERHGIVEGMKKHADGVFSGIFTDYLTSVPAALFQRQPDLNSVIYLLNKILFHSCKMKSGNVSFVDSEELARRDAGEAENYERTIVDSIENSLTKGKVKDLMKAMKERKANLKSKRTSPY